MIHYNPLLQNTENDKKFITMGEIMLRLTPPNYEKIRMASGFEASYGGSEANIALALANLGVDSTFFSVVPNNSLGKSAVRRKRRPIVWARITWKQATASVPARSSTTANTAPWPNTISRMWI